MQGCYSHGYCPWPPHSKQTVEEVLGDPQQGFSSLVALDPESKPQGPASGAAKTLSPAVAADANADALAVVVAEPAQAAIVAVQGAVAATALTPCTDAHHNGDKATAVQLGGVNNSNATPMLAGGVGETTLTPMAFQQDAAVATATAMAVAAAAAPGTAAAGRHVACTGGTAAHHISATPGATPGGAANFTPAVNPGNTAAVAGALPMTSNDVQDNPGAAAPAPAEAAVAMDVAVCEDGTAPQSTAPRLLTYDEWQRFVKEVVRRLKAVRAAMLDPDYVAPPTPTAPVTAVAGSSKRAPWRHKRVLLGPLAAVSAMDGVNGGNGGTMTAPDAHPDACNGVVGNATPTAHDGANTSNPVQGPQGVISRGGTPGSGDLTGVKRSGGDRDRINPDAAGVVADCNDDDFAAIVKKPRVPKAGSNRSMLFKGIKSQGGNKKTGGGNGVKIASSVVPSGTPGAAGNNPDCEPVPALQQTLLQWQQAGGQRQQQQQEQQQGHNQQKKQPGNTEGVMVIKSTPDVVDLIEECTPSEDKIISSKSSAHGKVAAITATATATATASRATATVSGAHVSSKAVKSAAPSHGLTVRYMPANAPSEATQEISEPSAGVVPGGINRITPTLKRPADDLDAEGAVESGQKGAMTIRSTKEQLGQLLAGYTPPATAGGGSNVKGADRTDSSNKKRKQEGHPVYGNVAGDSGGKGENKRTKEGHTDLDSQIKGRKQAATPQLGTSKSMMTIAEGSGVAQCEQRNPLVTKDLNMISRCGGNRAGVEMKHVVKGSGSDMQKAVGAKQAVALKAGVKATADGRKLKQAKLSFGGK